ncbi:hypothetical protein RvY_08413 [Ramazzottius varieornatus]|uniref:Uncharacterized protein n=1 Tax=Ramazzottius varieornatus TaxID=947166 RepID=A0A1D1V5S3_RAMVA|nr:hypothetical protein RvY_08413 [Ramazzottius varieornatus]
MERFVAALYTEEGSLSATRHHAPCQGQASLADPQPSRPVSPLGPPSLLPFLGLFT